MNFNMREPPLVTYFTVIPCSYLHMTAMKLMYLSLINDKLIVVDSENFPKLTFPYFLSLDSTSKLVLNDVITFVLLLS